MGFACYTHGMRKERGSFAGFRSRIIATLLILFLASVGNGATNAVKDTGDLVVVVQKKVSNGEWLRVKNRTPGDIVVRFQLKGENVRFSEAMPLDRTIAANETVDLVRISGLKAGSRWSYTYSYEARHGNLKAEHQSNVLYQLPYAIRKAYPVLQGFNGAHSHTNRFMYSVDFAMPKGTPIHAAREGNVVGVKQSSDRGGSNPDWIDEANYIVIQHFDGTFAHYAHLRHKGVVVAMGQTVKKGQLIGYSGNTGWSTQPHLHFAVHTVLGAEPFGRTVPIRFFHRYGVVANPKEWVDYECRKVPRALGE